MLIDKIKSLANAIAADIKAIAAKTDLLKSAAYRDVGTDDGEVPEFVGTNGIAGLGYGGFLPRLPADANANTYFEDKGVTRTYTAWQATSMLNFPAAMMSFSSRLNSFTFEVIGKDYWAIEQNISAVFSAANTSEESAIVKYSRVFEGDRWTSWRVVYDSREKSSAESGFGSISKKLAAGTDLDLLPRINAIYYATTADNILNRPPDLVSYVFGNTFSVECIVSDASSLFIQRLTLNAFPPSGTDTTNTVVFIRSRSFSGFSPWVRLTGKMYGVDVGGEVVGDDLVVNSIKAGDTSPKIAFELVRLDITYANFGYAEDGITPNNPNLDMRGYQAINSSIPATRILDLSLRLYGAIYKNYGDSTIMYANQGTMGTDTYATSAINPSGGGYLVNVKTAAHSIELKGDTGESGENLFDGGYAELFVTYRVD